LHHAVAQPHLIAFALLGQLYDAFGNNHRCRVVAVDQASFSNHLQRQRQRPHFIRVQTHNRR
jgi:hypothetical protein